MRFSCPIKITGFFVRNTHNGHVNDRGTEQYTIWTGKLGGSLQSQPKRTLSDPRQKGPAPLEKMSLVETIEADVLVFQIDSYYGNGG